MKKYYGVAYLANGDACVCSACESEEEVMNELRKVVMNHPTEIIATTYMAREEDSLMKIFGHPKSRDVIQDKKFMKEVTR